MNLTIKPMLYCAVATLAAISSYAQLIHSSVSATTYRTLSDWYNQPPETITKSDSRASAGPISVTAQSTFAGLTGIAAASSAPGTLHVDSIADVSTFWHYHDGIIQWVAGTATTDSKVSYSDQLTFYTPKLAMGAPLSVSINLGVRSFLYSFFDMTNPADSAGHGSVELSLALADTAANYVQTLPSPYEPYKTVSLLAQVANGASVPLSLGVAAQTMAESFSGVNHIGAPPGIFFTGHTVNQDTTLTWAGVDFFSPTGGRLSGMVSSESGFDYGRSYFMTPVPEPTLFAFAGAGLLSVILIGRIRRNVRLWFPVWLRSRSARF